MDAETRHQLKQNELAGTLDKLREMKDPKYRYTVLGLIALLVAVVVWNAVSSSRAHAAEKASARLFEVTTALAVADEDGAAIARENMQAYVDEVSDPALGGYARLSLAGALISDALKNPDQRPAAFENAAALLTEITTNTRTPGPLAAAARFSLATTYESLRQPEKARELYQDLTTDDRFRGSPFELRAFERLNSMDVLEVAVHFEPGDPPAAATQQPSALDTGGFNIQPANAPPGISGQGLTPEQIKKLFASRQDEGAAAPAPTPSAAPDQPAAEQPAADEPEPPAAEQPAAEPAAQQPASAE